MCDKEDIEDIPYRPPIRYNKRRREDMMMCRTRFFETSKEFSEHSNSIQDFSDKINACFFLKSFYNADED